MSQCGSWNSKDMKSNICLNIVNLLSDAVVRSSATIASLRNMLEAQWIGTEERCRGGQAHHPGAVHASIFLPSRLQRDAAVGRKTQAGTRAGSHQWHMPHFTSQPAHFKTEQNPALLVIRKAKKSALYHIRGCGKTVPGTPGANACEGWPHVGGDASCY